MADLRDYHHHIEVLPAPDEAAAIEGLVADISKRLGLEPVPRVGWFLEVTLDDAIEALRRRANVFVWKTAIRGCVRGGDVWVCALYLTAAWNDVVELIDTLAHELYHLKNPEQPEQAALAYGNHVGDQYRSAVATAQEIK